MLTIFTSTKPFEGHNGIVQTNAIKSWMRLGSKVNIILIGGGKGTKEFARKNHLKYISRVKTNKYKTPLVSSIFEVAEKNSSDPILVYVNADVILFPKFLEIIRKISTKFSKYLVIGQRIDINIKDLINFDDKVQIQKLNDQVEKTGKLHAVTGIDYFLYPRGFWGKIPDFGIGRARWDNWLVYRGKQLGTVIDATQFIKVVHQNHDYFHLSQGLRGKRFKAELKINEKLAEGHSALVSDSDYLMTNNGFAKNFRFGRGNVFLKIFRSLISPTVNI